jgi:hypothetical protein
VEGDGGVGGSGSLTSTGWHMKKKPNN